METQKKFDDRRTGKPVQYEKNSGKSKTVPNQSMTIQEVAGRFVRGQSVQEVKKIYQDVEDFDFGLDVFEAMDKCKLEMQELREKYKNMLQKSEFIKKQKEEAAANQIRIKKEKKLIDSIMREHNIDPE